MAARLSTASRNTYFGSPGKVRTVLVRTPWGINVQVHAAVRDAFVNACNEAARTQSWRPQRIDGYVVRSVRGSTSPSLHGYALAWDFFATGPNVVPPGGVWTPHNGVPASFAACFTRRGFTWGANWDRKDVPHIEWAGAPPAATAGNPPQPDKDDDVALTNDQTRALAMIPAMALRIEQLQNELTSSTGYLRPSVAATQKAAQFGEQYIRETVRIARALAADAGVEVAAAAK